jgi:hypothetical protein
MLKTVSSTINAIGALNYKGTWDAATNNPTLTSGVGVKGDYYVVSVAGTTNLDGVDFWGVGDWAVFNGAVWQRVEGGSETDTDAIVFNTAANLTPTNGEMTWDNNDRRKTVAVGINGDQFYLFEDAIVRVKASGTITKGQVVMFTGGVGSSGGLTAAPATGLLPDQSNYILGISVDNIATNSWGNIKTSGEIRGINTTGGGEGWVQGEELYASATTPGALTKIKPTAPAAITRVADVVNVSASNGIIFVRISYGSTFGATDGNVNFTSLANNDVVVYNSGSNVWTNKPNANLVASTGLTGGGVLIPNTSVSVALANTAVTAATYGSANTAVTITVDQQGRLTNASNATIAISNSQVSGLGTMSTQNANNVAITGGTVSVSNITASNVSVTANLFANLATSNTAAMPDPSLPLNPEGYLSVVINGATKKIPYYGV